MAENRSDRLSRHDITMAEAVEMLLSESLSCVIVNGGRIYKGRSRGVKDLLRLHDGDSGLLRGAAVADKVVGKGAAAIMVSGGVRRVHAQVASTAAIRLFEAYGVEVEAVETADHIINRRGDGICPVETICIPLGCDIEACIGGIRRFVESMESRPH